MKIIRRRWADSCTPFGRDKCKWFILGTNWRGYVYVMNVAQPLSTASECSEPSQEDLRQGDLAGAAPKICNQTRLNPARGLINGVLICIWFYTVIYFVWRML